MRLLIDSGNTLVMWALTASDHPLPAWEAQGSLTHEALAGLASELKSQDIDAVWISNVAGDVLANRLTQILAGLGLAENALHWFASLPACGGVRNGYREPAQLGCDRFAALIGARHHHPDRQPLAQRQVLGDDRRCAHWRRAFYWRHDSSRLGYDGAFAGA